MKRNYRRDQTLTCDLWMSPTILGSHPGLEQFQKRVKDAGRVGQQMDYPKNSSATRYMF